MITGSKILGRIYMKAFIFQTTFVDSLQTLYQILLSL